MLLQDTLTRTTSYNTPAIDFGQGFAPGGVGRPMSAVLHATALDTSSGDETYKLTLQQSADNITFAAIGAEATVTAVGVSLIKGHVTQRYVRLAMVLAGTTPSISFKAWLNPLP